MLYFILLACTQSSIQDSAEELEEILFVSPDQEGPYDAGLHSFSFVRDRGRELSMADWYPAMKG